jgi:hypothetical protein
MKTTLKLSSLLLVMALNLKSLKAQLIRYHINNTTFVQSNNNAPNSILSLFTNSDGGGFVQMLTANNNGKAMYQSTFNDTNNFYCINYINQVHKGKGIMLTMAAKA